MEYRKGIVSKELPMNRRVAHPMVLSAMLLGLWPAPIAKADDQQRVVDYLQSRGISGAVVRPVTDDFVGRTFPTFSFFGVIFRQYPVAVQCPQATDLKCANLFFVQNSQVDFVSTIEDLKFFFAMNLGPAPTQNAATDAADTWLRFSEELKQDLFYTFSPSDVSYTPRSDLTLLRAHASVVSGGEGNIDVVMTLGAAGSFVSVLEKSALRPGVRPICQATKLLDRDPIVRRMAEQDLLVMGRAAKPYLDQIRVTAQPGLQLAIDRIWQRILNEGR
jgi:hypothetical protein